VHYQTNHKFSILIAINCEANNQKPLIGPMMKDTKAKIKPLLFLFCVINNGKTFLTAFRSRHRCQTALLKIIEDWKKALDDNKFVATILMDLSKAFSPNFEQHI
jgi:hypothetical protein